MPEVSADTKIGANRPLAGPPPNLVPYNDWQTLEVPPIDSFKPNMAVSVVVPYFQAPEELGRTLATLERQTYPRDLFEVVVVDDGSREPLQWPKNTPLNLTVVHQENRGFGAARARNTGARAAKHDILVFLDCDMLAEAGLLTAHARWHHVVSDAITQGFYSRVAVEAIHAEAIRKTSGSIKNLLGGPFDPPSKERFMSRTADLMSKKDNLYQIASSGNLGVAKPFFESIGGYDESFTRYGREDTEFVYRAYIQGALLVPARDAFAWHQGEWEAESETKRDSWSRHGKAVNLIAHHSFRPASPGRIFAVPRYVVSIRADSEPIEQVAQATESILADTEFDLVVRIEVSATRHSDQVNWLEEHFGPDPRVRVAPTSHALDQFPASPFHVTLPPVAKPPRGLIHDLQSKLGDGVYGHAVLRDGSTVTIAKARALHRARRTGKSAAEFGDTVEIRIGRGGLICRLGLNRTAMRRARWRRPGLRARVELVAAKAGQVRGPRTAWAFLKWLVEAARWRWQRRDD